MKTASAQDRFSMVNPYNSYRNSDVREGMYEYVPSRISVGYIREAMRIFKARTGRNAKTFLDLGCGKGAVLYTALEANLEPTGVEISKELLKIAKQIQNLNIIPDSEKITFIQGNILKWVPDKAYDIVYFFRPLSDAALFLQFVKHVHRVFPIGQQIIAISGVQGYIGFERMERTNVELYVTTDIPAEILKINGYPVVAKFDNYYIYGAGKDYYRVSSSRIKEDDSGRHVAGFARKLNNFELIN
jgi:SAM-dependent methyltransferase